MALDVTDGPVTTRRAAVAAGLLLLSLMSSGTGLVVSVAVGGAWLLDANWRRHVLWLAVPAGAYLAWYAAFGRAGVTFMRNPFTLEAAGDVPAFVIRGLGNAGGAITGLGPLLGIPVFVSIVAWVYLRARQRSLDPIVPGLLAAIVAQYALIGLVRGNVFPDQVNYTRYTYVSGILLLVALGALAGRVSVPRLGRWRTLVVAAGLSVLALAFTFNLQLLIGGREVFLERADMTRALVTAGLERPLPPETEPDRSLVLVPSPASLERIVGAYGDPRTDRLVPWAVRSIPRDVMTEARRRVREGAPIPQPEG
jgi:hypothetical protein